VQVDPIKPTLIAPMTKRLKLKYDELLSNIAFKFNLRRYTQDEVESKKKQDAERAEFQAGGDK